MRPISATRASDTFGHIAAACAAGNGDRDGLRQRPARPAQHDGARPWPCRGNRRQCRCGGRRRRRSPASSAPPRRFRAARTRRPAIGRSRPCRCRSNGDIFPQTVPTFPADLTEAIIRRGRPARHTRRLPCLRHRDHRAVRRGAYPHRQADLLHLGRFGLPDRRARDAFRSRTPLRPVQDRAQAGRSAQYRPRHRPAVRRRDGSRPSSGPPTAAILPCRRRSRRCSTGWSSAAAR